MMLCGRRYGSRSVLSSAIYLCPNSINRANYFAAFRSWISTHRDLKSVFLLKENILKERNVYFDCMLSVYLFIAQ